VPVLGMTYNHVVYVGKRWHKLKKIVTCCLIYKIKLMSCAHCIAFLSYAAGNEIEYQS